MHTHIYTAIHDRIQTHPMGVIIIYGPTATGKTGLSVGAHDFLYHQGIETEIISADSRQIYRGMDIGTDTIERSIQDRIPHHQIDIVDPDAIYTARQRQQDTYRIIDEIHDRGAVPMIVGGTGLYIDTIYKNFSMPPAIEPNRAYRDSLEAIEKNEKGKIRQMLDAVDPVSASQIHPHAIRYIIRSLEIHHMTGQTKTDLVRTQPVRFPVCMISLTRDIQIANERIYTRVGEMLDMGLYDEVAGLYAQGYDAPTPSMMGIGYSQLLPMVKGEAIYTHATAQASIGLASVQYAKRQRSRFRRYQKDALEHPVDNVTYMSFDM